MAVILNIGSIFNKSTLDISPPPLLNFQIIAPTRSNYRHKKSAILDFFPVIIELVFYNYEVHQWLSFWILVVSLTRGHSTLARRHYWTSKLSCPQGQIIDIKNPPFCIFFPVIIELVCELLNSNMHNKFEQDTWETLYVIMVIVVKLLM